MENRVVVFDLPFPLLMGDFEQAGEICIAASPPAGIGIHRRMNDRPAIQSPGVLAGGDPYGRVSYSRVQVRFHVPTSPEVGNWDDDELIVAAVDRVNRLVEQYRDTVGDYLARPVSLFHLVHFTIIDESEDGKRQQRIVSRGEGPLRVGFGDEDTAQEAEIRARLRRDEPPAIQRMIELDIRVRLSTGEYRLAVVEAATLFESWLRPALEQAFIGKGETPAEVAAHFSQPNGAPRGVRKIVTAVLPVATGYSGFESTPEFANWDEARELRNDLVHGHRLKVSAAEAIGAVDAVVRAIQHLQAHGGLT